MSSNYGKNLFREFEGALLKIDFLIEENKVLKNKVVAMEENQKKEITQLNSKITALETENQKLKDIINKDSGNSSKPPSSDGFKKIQNSREKSDKKAGGQKGHTGNTLKLFENPTKIIEYKKTVCHCGSHNIVYDVKYKAKQFVDFEIKANIVEHRSFTGICNDCKAVITNELPLTNNVTYGNTIKSFSLLLSSEGIVSIGRITGMISELTNNVINLSDGTIVNWLGELGGKLNTSINKIKDDIMLCPVNHKDETGFRINNKMQWLHVLSNKDTTLYFSHMKRGNIADKSINILPSYSGVLVHDHLKGLYNFTCEHAECNAHILRYLKAAIESKNRNWAKEMIEFLVNANNEIKELKSVSVLGFDKDSIQNYINRYDGILENGQDEFKNDHSKTKNYNGDDMKLLRRMKEYKTEHLRFITDFNVPFDNNLAERDLRMIKAKSKISGCFRSDKGSKNFADIKSYTSTLKKRNKNIFQGISVAFLGEPTIC